MERLDKELVLRGLAETRTKSIELIKNGLVKVNGKVIFKASFQISNDDSIEIMENNHFKYVSRGGYKLEKALKVFNYDLTDKIVMDIGSSTGGFTDCCLQNGAKKVVAIDVGTNVMHKLLRNNEKVELHENLNIKDASSEMFKNIDVVVTDVSFISLTKIVEKVSLECDKIDMICLIKPQFECGKEIAKKCRGVILNKAVHNKILCNLIDYFNSIDFYIQGLNFSPIKGGDGNIEYLAHINNKSIKNKQINISSVIDMAFDNLKKK